MTTSLPLTNERCECGSVVSPRGRAAHLAGMPHKCAMSYLTAHEKGHTVRLNGRREIPETLLHLAARFSWVDTFHQGGPRRRGKVTRSLWTDKAMARLLQLGGPMRDDEPDGTLQAALLFASMHGDDAGRVVFDVLQAEARDGCDDSRTSGLIAILRANRIKSPARTLVNLIVHLAPCASL